LSPNKKVTKEIGIGEALSCLLPRRKTRNRGMIATGNHKRILFAARSTTLSYVPLQSRTWHPLEHLNEQNM